MKVKLRCPSLTFQPSRVSFFFHPSSLPFSFSPSPAFLSHPLSILSESPYYRSIRSSSCRQNPLLWPGSHNTKVPGSRSPKTLGLFSKFVHNKDFQNGFSTGCGQQHRHASVLSTEGRQKTPRGVSIFGGSQNVSGKKIVLRNFLSLLYTDFPAGKKMLTEVRARVSGGADCAPAAREFVYFAARGVVGRQWLGCKRRKCPWIDSRNRCFWYYAGTCINVDVLSARNSGFFDET